MENNNPNDINFLELAKKFILIQRKAHSSLKTQFEEEVIDLYQSNPEDLFKNLEVLMYYRITPSRLDNLLKIYKACPNFNLFDEVSLGAESSGKIVKNLEILLYELGQINSLKCGESVNKFGNAIPWITYPALEFLSQFDFSCSHIYEFGSGNSTLFWADRFKSVTSVETEKDWYERVSSLKPPNVKLSYFDKADDFSTSILKEEGCFDVIFIDSIRYRYEVTRHSIEKLNVGGIIIFDNADWYPNSSKVLRDEGFFEIDFHGFGPINGYAWTTSIFFKGEMSLKRLDKKIRPIGGIDVTLSDDGPFSIEDL